MLHKISVRQRILLCTAVPGAVFLVIAIATLLGVNGLALNILRALVFGCLAGVLALLHFSPLERHDELSREALRDSASKSFLWNCVGTYALVVVCHFVPSIQAEAALEMVLALLFISFGVSFLILMGREDAYLED